MSVEGRQKLETLRDEIKSFLGTSVHLNFVRGNERQIAILEEVILNDPVYAERPVSFDPSKPPVSGISIYELIEFRAHRAALKANLTLFEDAVATLENSIQKLLDEENETQPNQK